MTLDPKSAVGAFRRGAQYAKGRARTAEQEQKAERLVAAATEVLERQRKAEAEAERGRMAAQGLRVPVVTSRSARRPVTEREPTPPPPITFSMDQVQVIGTKGDNTVFTLPGLPDNEIELLAGERPVADAGTREELQSGVPYLEAFIDAVDGEGTERIWRRCRLHPLGWLHPTPKAGKQRPPSRPLDVFAEVSKLNGRRGPAMVPHLEAKGYRIEPVGEHGLLIEPPNGRDVYGIRPVLTQPGVVAFLRGWKVGKPPLCQHPDHQGAPEPAWSVSLGGCQICLRCVR